MKFLFTQLILIFATINLQAQLVTTVAGQPEISGSNDGEAFTATFNNPHGIAVDINGTVYTADRFSHIIRKITLDGMVTTLAGTAGVSGNVDGTGDTALFYEPWGLCVDGVGNVFVADTRNNKIRKITPDGTVTTIAGSGNFGTSNGFGVSATFGNPTGIEVDGVGNIYVADHLTHIIRKIDELGFVTTIAGMPYQMGDADGVGNQASFRRPYGLTLDLNGDILVADEWNHKIRRVTPSGQVTTLAGDGAINSDDGLANNASFNYPWDMTVDSLGNIFVADGYNYTVRKITPNGQVSTYAGSVQQTGAIDGVGNVARFSGATAIAMSPVTKDIYVGDAYNHLVRTITDLNQGVSLALTSGSNVICQGDFVSLIAAPNVYTDYHFYVDGQIAQSGADAVFETTVLAPGMHTLQVLAQDNAASFTSNEITIQVNEGEKPTITNVGATTFFEGDSITLIASFGTNYFWSTGESSPTITVFDAGIYTVEVTDNAGCVGVSDPIEIIVQTTPSAVTIEVEGGTIICNNEFSTLSSNAPANNQWLKDGWAIAGAINSTFEVNESGNYQVQVTHENNVVVISDPVEVTVLPPFQAEINVSSNTGKTTDVFQFQISSQETIMSVTWDFGDGNTSTEISPTHQYDTEGTYTVTVFGFNSNQCEYIVENIDYVVVQNENNGNTNGNTNAFDGDLFVPTAFTPNGDGENDILFVRGSDIQEMTFLIFNQWGETVFRSNDQQLGWDGTMSGLKVQIGTYVYMLDYIDSKGVKRKVAGHVTVIM